MGNKTSTRGATEVILTSVNENEELRNKISKLETLAIQLTKEITALKEENKMLKRILHAQKQEGNEVNNTGPYEYFTDEEELTRETDCVLKKKRPNKERKAEELEAEKIKTTETNKQTNKQEQNRAQPRDKQFPPINIVNITNHADIQSLMNTIAAKKYGIVALNNNRWKINTHDSDTYRALAKKLNEDVIQWYTYEDKNRRPIKVMARGLHETCAKVDIMKDPQKKGLKI